MKTNLNHVSKAVSLLALTFLAACAGQETTRTGFLPNYSHMQASKAGDETLRFSQAPAAPYHAFMIDTVAYMPGAKSEAEVTPEEIAEVTTAYQEAARAVFAERYQEVNAPGAGVMRVRLAVTGIDKARSTLNYATVLLVGPVSNGGASSEAEVIDSLSGAQIAALATHTNADPFNGGLFEYFTRTGHAKSVLADHAKQLRDAVPATQQLSYNY